MLLIKLNIYKAPFQTSTSEALCFGLPAQYKL